MSLTSEQIQAVIAACEKMKQSAHAQYLREVEEADTSIRAARSMCTHLDANGKNVPSAFGAKWCGFCLSYLTDVQHVVKDKDDD